MAQRDVDPVEIFKYASRFALQAQKEGAHCLYPTIGHLAMKFRTSQSTIVESVDDYDGPGYMGVVVGWSGGSGGLASIDRKANQLVEAYE